MVLPLRKSADNPLVGVIVLNYRNYEGTRRCLRSLEQLDYQPFEIFLVDNASNDFSLEKLESEFGDNVSVVRSSDNHGYAGGNNLGIRSALARGCKYVWIVNHDVEVTPPSLSELVRVAEEDVVTAAVGSKVLYAPTMGEKARIWGLGGTLNKRECLVNMHYTGEHDREMPVQALPCDYVPGCSILVKTSVLAEVGLIPEEYFMYFEETEWCERMTQKGFRLFAVPESVVLHHVEADKMQSEFQVYYYNRNELFFWFRNSRFRRRVKLYVGTLTKRLYNIQRAIHGTRDLSIRSRLLAQRAAYVDFLLGRRGRKRY